MAIGTTNSACQLSALPSATSRIPRKAEHTANGMSPVSAPATGRTSALNVMFLTRPAALTTDTEPAMMASVEASQGPYPAMSQIVYDSVVSAPGSLARNTNPNTKV